MLCPEARIMVLHCSRSEDWQETVGCKKITNGWCDNRFTGYSNASKTKYSNGSNCNTL